MKLQSFSMMLALMCLFALPAVAGEEVRHVLRAGGLEVVIVVDSDALEAEHGPRFVRTARVTEVRRDGLSFLTEPGLADEFAHDGEGTAGFSTSDRFLKPGVGVLGKEEGNETYDPFWRYPVLEPVEVRVTEAAEDLLTVEAKHAEAGGVILTLGQKFTVTADGILRMEYSLRNDGAQPWRGRHYNHHFFAIGGRRPDDGHVLRPRGVPEGEPKVWRGWVRATDGWRLSRWPSKARAAAAVFERRGEPAPEAELSGFELANDHGGRVLMRSSRPAAVFTAWADYRSMCPEIFVNLEAPPGGTTHWTSEYRFGD